LGLVFGLIGARRNEIRSRPPLFAAKLPHCLPEDSGARCFAFIKAQFCRRGLVCRSCWRRLSSKARDERQDVFEHLSQHPDLGHLKDGVAAIANHLRADLESRCLNLTIN